MFPPWDCTESNGTEGAMRDDIDSARINRTIAILGRGRENTLCASSHAKPPPCLPPEFGRSWGCVTPSSPSILVFLTMKTTLSLSPAAQIETECLVAVVLDRAELDRAEKDQGIKDKTEAFVSVADKAVQQAAADLISAGDLTGKNFEVSWLHRPAGIKAKRLLLIGGGKAKKFSASELRKLAGAAVRALKPRSLRSLAFVLPEEIPPQDAVEAVVEGAIIGNFDPDTYKSDRKDQNVESLTVVASNQTSGDLASLQRALD